MAEGRDQKGRFGKGNAGGPGRTPRATEASYLKALQEGVTAEDWRAIVRRAVEQAREGDAAARTWLGRLLLPAERGRQPAAPERVPPPQEQGGAWSPEEIQTLLELSRGWCPEGDQPTA